MAIVLIPLTQGKFARISSVDIHLAAHKWYAQQIGKGRFYASRHESGTNRQIYLHRAVLKTDKHVDHIDHDTLNCTRENLRVATRQENCRNRKPGKNLKGAYPRDGRFDAYIAVSGKGMYLGRYDTREEAARAYDAKAKELFGEFACLNFPELQQAS